MTILVEKDYHLMSAKAAEDIMKVLHTLKNPLICPATGDSPKGLYHEMIKQINHRKTSISHWNFVGLDEWAGMNGDDEGSCRFHLNRQFFTPLAVPAENDTTATRRTSRLSRSAANIRASSAGDASACIGVPR